MHYLHTVAVFCAELLKVCVCGVALLAEGFCSGQDGAVSIAVVCDPWRLLHVAIPCVLYIAQNNLLIIALSNLSTAEYQVTYQLKILSTAFLSVLVLGRKLSIRRWLSLLMLSAGVMLVQWREGGWDRDSNGMHARGLFAVLCACMTSGLGGVLMERNIKSAGCSIWVTNFQVASISAALSLVTVFLQDGLRIRHSGFFQGFSYVVWAVVWVQALGGLVISCVMKYADNILKCFGHAFAISVSCLVSSHVIHEFVPDRRFVAGTAMVLVSIIMYGLDDRDYFRRSKLEKDKFKTR